LFGNRPTYVLLHDLFYDNIILILLLSATTNMKKEQLQKIRQRSTTYSSSYAKQNRKTE